MSVIDPEKLQSLTPEQAHLLQQDRGAGQIADRLLNDPIYRSTISGLKQQWTDALLVKDPGSKEAADLHRMIVVLMQIDEEIKSYANKGIIAAQALDMKQDMAKHQAEAAPARLLYVPGNEKK